MNRREQQLTLRRDHASPEVGVWTLSSEDDFPSIPRGRRLRRQIASYRSDFVWSLLTFLLLVWMGLVALTLWH